MMHFSCKKSNAKKKISHLFRIMHPTRYYLDALPKRESFLIKNKDNKKIVFFSSDSTFSENLFN